MAVWMSIPVDRQITHTTGIEGARQSVLTRGLALAIKQHLMPDVDQFEIARAAFAARADFAHVESAASRAVLMCFGLLAPGPGQGADGQVGDAVERVFCQGLHALCWAFGTARLGPDEPLEDGGEPLDAATDPHHVPLAAAVGNLASMMERWIDPGRRDATLAQFTGPEQAEVQEALAPRSVTIYLIAKALIEALVHALGDETVTLQTSVDAATGGSPRTRAYLRAEKRLRGRVEVFVKAAPYGFTLQPLTTPAAFPLRPGDTRTGASGAVAAPADDANRVPAFDVALLDYRRTNDVLREFLRTCVNAADFAEYIEAVNRQQSVAWRLNTRLLYWVQCFKHLVVAKDRRPAMLAEILRDAGLSRAQESAWRDWVRRNFYRAPGAIAHRRGAVLPGEFLDNPLVASVLSQMVGEGAEDEPRTERFYLPWKADYRGRIYVHTPWFTPQGGDLQRAMLEFADGQVLNDAGVRALRLHGANLVKRGRILADLGIRDRAVVTHEEKLRWVQEHEQQILQSGEHPLVQTFWRDEASKPLQFLAFCLAYGRWKQRPADPCHLPVQIDGTCNGLQHIAALTGSTSLARAVNVLPRDDGQPADIYSELAHAARERAYAGDLKIPGRKAVPVSVTAADALLGEHPRVLSRSVAKAVVMTVPYGAGPDKQSEGVYEELLDGGWLDEPTGQLAGRLKEIGRLAISEAEIARDNATKRRANSSKPAKTHDDRSLQREGLRKLAYAATLRLREALARTYPEVPRFADWLKAVASSFRDLPLVWFTPLGLPVCQPGFATQRAARSISIGHGKVVKIGYESLSNKVAPWLQSAELLPNLIHSLDATHLAMTINAAAARGISRIGSIHDCLLCLPNDAGRLGEAVREAFAHLYRPSPGQAGDRTPQVLAQWHQWMAFASRFGCADQPATVLGCLPENAGPMQNTALLALLAPNSKHLFEKLNELKGARREVVKLLLGASTAMADKERTAKPMVELPQRASSALAVDCVKRSDYFFS